MDEGCPEFEHLISIKKYDIPKDVIFFGDLAENRTPDNLIKSQVLCQLSY